VLSLDELVFFLFEGSDVIIDYISLEDAFPDTRKPAICGLSMVADHRNQFYK